MIFANYNPLIRSLISRLDREGNTVFVVTGQEKKDKSKPKGVFQEYNFSYNSDSIEFIISNIGADIAIFEYALDKLSQLESEPSKISEYLGAITNIILSLKNSKVKQLIYISNLRMFDGNSETIIDEQTLPKPIKNAEKTILMGEEICRNYDKDRQFKVNIVRLSELYGSYKGQYLEDNISADISKKILKNEKFEISKTKKHNLLYIDDAVDAIYKVLNSEGGNYEIYHIVSDRKNIYREKEIFDILQPYTFYDKGVNQIEDIDHMINKEYKSEKIRNLEFNEKYKFEDTAQKLYESIKKSIDTRSSSKGNKTSIFAKIFKMDGAVKNRLLPFMENLLFFIVLSIGIYITREMGFHEIIDIYLLYVVVIALIYGYEQSVFSVILSVILKIFISFNVGGYGSGLSEYKLYMWILQLFAIGILVGYLKEQYKNKYSDMKDENEYLSVQLESIKDINKSNEEIRDIYERRLVNYKDSFGRIYEIVSKLYITEPQAIIFKSIEIIGDIMGTKDVSIYIYNEKSKFFRLMASSSRKENTFKGSLKSSEHLDIFEKLFNGEIYTNNDLDPKNPIMAGATYKDNKLQTIIMIWSLPFESNNLYQTNVFAITCKLIERSLNVGYEYVANLSRNLNNEVDNIIDRKSFEKIVDLYKTGAKQGIVDYYLIKAKNSLNIDKSEFSEILKSVMRETDFIGESEGNSMCILLTNTNKEQSIYAIERLRDRGIEIIEGDNN